MPEKIIDIGVGESPYFTRFRMHCDAAEYVGVDGNEKRLQGARNKMKNPYPFRTPLRTEFVVANATQLPFSDATFTRSVLSNVLSAPIHYDWDKYAPEHTVKGFGFQDAFYVERKKVLDEALRVLVPGGTLIIYTDLIIHGQHSYEMLLEELRSHPRLRFETIEEEQRSIDYLNAEKILSGNYCYCFLGDLLPKAAVYRITKLDY